MQSRKSRVINVRIFSRLFKSLSAILNRHLRICRGIAGAVRRGARPHNGIAEADQAVREWLAAGA